MEVLKKQRTSSKAAITRAQTFLSISSDTAACETFVTRLKLLDTAWLEYRRIHAELLRIVDDHEVEEIEEDYEHVETQYVEVSSKLNGHINALTTTTKSNVGANTTNGNIKLPRIELPQFSGNFLEWTTFRDLFKSLVHENNSISASQKLHYLKSAVCNDAANLLQSIEVTEANYVEAWGLMEERYQNERLLVHSHIQAIVAFPSLAEESAEGIRNLIDNTVKHLRALSALGVEATNWDPIIVYTVTDKLDVETRRQWELSSPGKIYPPFSELKNYLEQRCRALEASAIKPKIKFSKPGSVNATKPKTKQTTASYHTSSGNSGGLCMICGGNHLIYKCDQLVQLDDKNKLAAIRKHNLCFNCLRNNHTSQQCKSESRCRKCNAKHHTLLHFNRSTSQSDEGSGPSVQTTNSISNYFSGHVGLQTVLLSTVMVNVKDCWGNQRRCRAILDSGSQASFVTEHCAHVLGLKKSKAVVSIFGIGHVGSGVAKGVVEMQLSSITSPFTFDITALVMTKLTGVTPARLIPSENWVHLNNLNLADPTFGKPGVVDIILGADVFGELILDGKLIGIDNTPAAYNTKLGWVISGRLAHNTTGSVLVNFVDLEIQDQLKCFWELEEIVSKKQLTPEEMECERHFQATHTRDSDGRFQVRLPFKIDTSPLGKSKDTAIQRLRQVNRRLVKDSELHEQYQDFLQQYLELGHMQQIPIPQQAEVIGKTNYLPHHFVTKESTTTRLRVVFDASAKTSSGASLNDNLLVGPKLQDDIWDILVRFRLHKYAFSADIAMMYRQIKMNAEDANFQRIVWKPSSDELIQEFRLTTIAFGTASAPYLATKVIQQLAYNEREQFPLAHDVVMKDFYIDDLMSGADSIQHGLELQTQLIDMLRSGGFNLRKWSSNESSFLQAVSDKLRETKLPLEIGSGDSIKTLGLHWNTADDCFFVVHLNRCDSYTKRSVLSDVAILYDPLCWLAPVIISAKIFIQEMWTAGIAWDEQLPPKLDLRWRSLRGQLHQLQGCRIQRCVVGRKDHDMQLHGFCDASEMAYGAVVYLRSYNSDGGAMVRLVCSKTRVAPLKQVSLPRLELCGAVLLARLMAKVQSTIPLKLSSVHAWTDSTVTLAWISGQPRNWKTFVANRVSEIQELIPPGCWRHVRTKENPADLASRGLAPIELVKSTQWWNGPTWLINTKQWPATVKDHANNHDAALERRAVQVFISTTKPSWDLHLKFSSLNKLVRVTAFCLRFICNARCCYQERVFGALNTSELHQALLVCVKAAQSEAFGEHMESIKAKNNKYTPLQSLSPFVDEKGILRVGGRLRNSTCAYDQRFPMMLPKQHNITELIDESQLHAGPQATLAALNKKFWVINGKSVIRQLLHKCHKCFRDRAEVLQQQMADLPANRVEPARPFLHSGVDYAGPLLVKSRKGRGGQVTKVYIALFVCFATKAVHLELVSDLATSAFIAALRRFIARRGKCVELHSDNGTNFVGANRELKSLLKQFSAEQHNTLVTEFLSKEGIVWHFIPSKAPHFGGLWEAGIKSTKTHLRRVVGSSTLTFEELYTVLTQIEACLNSRPLCPISSDPADLDVLTPGHFLIGEALTALPEPNLTQLKLNRLDRWQMMQRMVQHFWSRWSHEYLAQLQQRVKWKSKRENLQLDDLVLIKEDNVPPLRWLRGRVVEVHPGKDNIVRVATVKTVNGTYKRPIGKLCLLPM